MRWQTIIESTVVSDEPRDGGGWFRHQSPHFFTELRPLSYEELRKSRTEEGEEFISDRIEHENIYHRMTGQPQHMSFLYATLVGYHLMDTPTDYPGYTYFFQLTDEEIHQCVF